MSNEGLTLFIFEGSKKEIQFIESLEKIFLGKRFKIHCIFDAEIYQLYKCLKEDDTNSLDIVKILYERHPTNNKKLNGYSSEDFAYIYLFFDYDAHATNADDEKIKELLSYFNDETEHGMLYLSYPMVEALYHYKDMKSFKFLTVKCKRRNCPNENCKDKIKCLKEPHYKTIVPQKSLSQLSNFHKYTTSIWQELIKAHLYKMNYLVLDSFEMPYKIQSQITIFNKQVEKHIKQPCPHVAVLSGFPIFLLDYYGCDGIKEKLTKG